MHFFWKRKSVQWFKPSYLILTEDIKSTESISYNITGLHCKLRLVRLVACNWRPKKKIFAHADKGPCSPCLPTLDMVTRPPSRLINFHPHLSAKWKADHFGMINQQEIFFAMSWGIELKKILISQQIMAKMLPRI